MIRITHKKFPALLAMAMLVAACGGQKKFIINDDAVPTVWSIETVNGLPPGNTVLSSGNPFLVFNNYDSSIRGNSGCNSILGKYATTPKGGIHFLSVKMTLLNCDSAYETNVQESLMSSIRYRRFKGGILRLYDAQDKATFVLRRNN